MRWPYDADDNTKLVELYVANDFSQVYQYVGCCGGDLCIS